MAILQTQLDFDSINVSAQIGDIVYHTLPDNFTGGFDSSTLDNTQKLGPIVEITNNSITVEYDSSIASPPQAGAFISFAKDKRVNTASLLGYYAQVDFENNSKRKVELFSVGADISESSK